MNPESNNPELTQQPVINSTEPAPIQDTAPSPPITPPQNNPITPLPLAPLGPEKTQSVWRGPRTSFGNVSELLFRIGFASIFLVNSVYAAIRPQDFIDLLSNNPIASATGLAEVMVKIAMVNDLFLSILILSGWRKKHVYMWAGIWLLMVASIKLMNLFT
jgi:hypothetical protein